VGTRLLSFGHFSLRYRKLKPRRAVVQVGGSAWRLLATALRAAVRRSPALSNRLLRYADAFLVQVSQSGVCRPGARREGLHILDRRGLEAACCGCYRLIQNYFEHMNAPSAPECGPTPTWFLAVIS
jgi:hypothetical protein